MRGLLNSTAVKEFIDSSSTGLKKSGRGSSLVTWDGLFAAVVEFVVRECESISKLDREKPTSGGVARKKLKQVSKLQVMYTRISEQHFSLCQLLGCH